jgi:hypothetical protein
VKQNFRKTPGEMAVIGRSGTGTNPELALDAGHGAVRETVELDKVTFLRFSQRWLSRVCLPGYNIVYSVET